MPELRVHLSPGEARFERYRRKVGLALAPALFLAVLLFTFPDLNSQQHRLLAVLALVTTLWITEALPLALTGLIAPLMMILLGVVPAGKAFSPFADPIMFLFIGAFILAKAIQLHGLDRRFAYAVLTRPWVGESPGRILFAFGFVCCVISMWISNTATVAMMFPIGIAIIHMLQHATGGKISDRYASALMLICTFSASIGGLATPVGTPTNLIGLGFIDRQLDVQVPFFEWMTFGVPIVVVMYLLLFLYLHYLSPAGVSRMTGIRTLLLEEKRTLGRFSKAERNTLAAFSVTVALWVTPGVFALTLGEQHPLTTGFSRHVPESVAALVGAALLFFIPIDRKKGIQTISLDEALKIDWGVLAMYGGGIALGHTVFETKLADALGKGLEGIVPTSGPGLVAFASLVATLTSELTSNVASANMIVPLVIALGGATATQAAIAASMASTLGFMLPISTPTNAIAYASGYVPLGRMIRYGVILDVIGFCVIVAGTLLLVPAG